MLSKSLFDTLLLEVVQVTLDAYRSRTDVDDTREMVFYKIEQLGFSAGFHLCSHLIASKPLVTDQLDIVKFICREYWQAVFGKQMDTLKTNHKGTFVLEDLDMALLKPFMNSVAHPDISLMTVVYLALPCGMIRGALHAFGVEAVVKANLSTFPQCSFDLNLVQ